jgi:hypothetical protein
MKGIMALTDTKIKNTKPQVNYEIMVDIVDSSWGDF